MQFVKWRFLGWMNGVDLLTTPTTKPITLWWN